MNENALRGMRCPHCGNSSNFDITTTVICKVDDDGSDANYSDHEWDDDSQCRCSRCAYEGVVRDFIFARENLVVLVLDGGQLKEVLYNGDDHVTLNLKIVEVNDFRKIGQEKELRHNLEAIHQCVASEKIVIDDDEGDTLDDVKTLMEEASEAVEMVSDEDYADNDKDPDNIDDDKFVPINFEAVPVTPLTKPNPAILP